jgi:hypothetical protein
VVAATEDDLQRVREALSSAAPASRRTPLDELDLRGAVDELLAWVGDDREQGSLYAGHWASLIGDVLWASEQCGPALSAVMAADAAVLAELQELRGILRSNRGVPDRALRRRIGHGANALTERLEKGETRLAAFRDIVSTSDPDVATEYARLFVALCGWAGRDEHWFPSRLRSLLADDSYAVAAERKDSLPKQPPGTAGTSPDERIAMAEAMVCRQPQRGEVIVWLRFSHAKLGWPPLLELGPHVRLFDDHWLRSVLSGEASQIEEHAPEAADEYSDVRSLVGEESEVTDDDKRSVFIRVVVADATGPQGREIARQTADAISGLASLYGTSPRLWELDRSYVVLTQDGSGGGSYGAPVPVGLDVDDQVELSNDHTGRTLADLAELAGPHLPVRDSAVAEAARLLSWLRAARAAPAAPRLMLCARVVEQVTGWAGFGDDRAFTAQILRSAWATGRIRNAVANAAFAASHELGRRRSTLVGSFSEPGAGWGGTVNLKAFLEHFDQVHTSLKDEGDVPPAVRRVAPYVRTPVTSARWLREHLTAFDRLEGRRRRTRNSLVHGGPLAARTVDVTVGFADSIAHLALGDCIEGRLAGEDLVDHFLARRVRRDSVLRRLDGGQALSEALFWGEDPAG